MTRAPRAGMAACAVAVAVLGAVLWGAWAPPAAADPGAAERRALRKVEAARTILADPDAPADKRQAAVQTLVEVVLDRTDAETEYEAWSRVLRAASESLQHVRSAEAARVVHTAGDHGHWAPAHYLNRALGGMEVDGRLDLVLDAVADAGNPHRRLGALAALTLFRVEDDLAIARTMEWLGRCLADDRWEVRLAAVRACAAQEGEHWIELLVGYLQDSDRSDRRVRAAATEALGALTGKPIGYDPAAWIAWWRHRDPPEGEPEFPTWWGIPVRSSRVAFLLELSEPMDTDLEDTSRTTRPSAVRVPDMRDPELRGLWQQWMNREPTTRLIAAQRELILTICSLPSDTHFAVVFYSEYTEVHPQRLVPASERNKLAACRQVAGQETLDKTNLWDAIAAALRFAPDDQGEIGYDPTRNYMRVLGGVDTVFLLNSREPDTGKLSLAEDILAEARKTADVRGVTYNTIVMGSRSREWVDRKLLEDIARASGGTFVAVD